MCHCSTWSAIEGTLPCFMPQPTHGMLQQAMCNSSVNGWRCKNCVVTAAVRAVGVSMRRRQCCAQQHSMRRGKSADKNGGNGKKQTAASSDNGLNRPSAVCVPSLLQCGTESVPNHSHPHIHCLDNPSLP